MTNGPVLWLDQIDPIADANRVGSKMGRLAELAAIGVHVPPGFAVTTSAYRRFCQQNAVDVVVHDRLAGRAEDLESVSAAIRERIEAAAIPTEVQDAIVAAYDELSDRCVDLNVPVAVRSSATGEDAADASFAGQFDTYLGIAGAGEVVNAVRQCWASLFTARAIRYRRDAGLTHADSPMAVGVLELVNARASGVAFSIHPVTGKTDRIVIEGSWGWGEAVVQGLVTPDHLEIDKDDGRVLRRDIAHKAVVSAFDFHRGGVVEIDMPARLRDAPILDDEQLAAVVDAVRRIEDHYGYAVDVEWVLDRHRRPGEPITVVQVRPETVHAGTAADTPGWDIVAAATKYAFGGP